MPAPTQPTPGLQLPTNLVSHPLAASSAHHVGPLPTLASSSARRSQAAIGASYKLSSDGRSVRRLKGILPVAIAGQSVSLINPLTQTPVQSFTLSPSDQICTAPLVVLRPRSGNRSLRTTYFGVRTKASSAASTVSPSDEPVKAEVWAFTEELSTKGKGTADGAVRKEVALVEGSVSLLHVLCSGHLVATLSDGSLAVLSHALGLQDETSQASSAASSAFRVMQTVPSAASESLAHLHVSLLDPTAAQPLVAGTSRIEEGTLQGLRIAISSAVAAPSSGASAASGKKNKKKGRKSAIEVIDEAEGRQDAAGPSPTGVATVSISALLRPVDEAADARLRTIALGTLALTEVGDASKLLDLQVYGDGRLVALTRAGELVSARLSLAAGQPTLSQWKRVKLANFAHASSGALPAAVLPLSKDHVLLVAAPQSRNATADGGRGQKERVVALLFDLEVEAVLTQIDWAMSPGSQSRLGVPPSISASRVAGSMAIIQLDPPRGSGALSAAADETPSSRVNLLALPFVVPDYSVLRHAMGKGELTRIWTADAPDSAADAVAASQSKDGAHSKHGSLSQHQRQLVETLEGISTSNGGKARAGQMDAAFEAWKNEEKARLGSTIDTSGDGQVRGAQDEDDIESILATVEVFAAKAGRSGKGARSRNAPEVDLPYNFVSALLPIVLPDASKPAMPYAKGVVHYLLTRRAVSSLMLSGSSAATGGSLLARLRARSDWFSIMLAIRHVPDVSELDLVLLLIEVLRADKKRLQSADGNGVSGDNAVKGKPPSTVEFLASFVAIAVSRPLLRGTLKARVNDVDDVAVLLRILKGWLDVAVRVPLEAGAKLPDNVPAVDLVLPFATDLLDTYFPLLISTPLTHELLRSLSKTIQLHLSGLNSLITLGAPLSAFAKLEEEKRVESLRAAAASAARGGAAHVGPGGAAMSAGNMKVAAGGKGAAAARAETGGGLGIGLGTEGVQKTRRAEAREESMLVGAYALERLEI
ncbi:uncharacterized protein PFL1_02235 [Pseudozyma flocculosa PF-1]|uniref:uncharacterized protein n=1 Tax=Pseudozyma flocculosa PF-1 TaxID=1277687 RepID=UPI0004560B0B|nr:uncharacterized protein PFL1_02235 [Pseudozyma flocculosa PF-1]EPQ30118.1 hypothetical protein PFL1_02235 [Pseudozyma flocculosa PF-1]